MHKSLFKQIENIAATMILQTIRDLRKQTTKLKYYCDIIKSLKASIQLFPFAPSAILASASFSINSVRAIWTQVNCLINFRSRSNRKKGHTLNNCAGGIGRVRRIIIFLREAEFLILFLSFCLRSAWIIEARETGLQMYTQAAHVLVLKIRRPKSQTVNFIHGRSN